MRKEEKIIMYDTPEAAEEITLTGWVSKGKDGRFFYKDEHMARWAGCTHLKCDCGAIMEKAYTRCATCRDKSQRERYDAMPFKEYDGDFVVEYNGDRFFWSEDEIVEYLEENDIQEINLLFCDPVHHRSISIEDIATDDCHDGYDPPGELIKKINELNSFIQTLPPHSYYPGKVRTTYKLNSTP